MASEEDYLEINRASWNKRVDSHYKSDFYAVNAFIAGKSSLNPIEVELLPNLQGKRVLHLQCHFGQDSLSLARLGAKVTGVDLSDEAIKKARALNSLCGLDAEFVCCDVYQIADFIKGRFDLVFSSYGTIGWLPDLEKWAGLISKYLKPGGSFVFAEFHPFVWMYNSDFSRLAYSYFKTEAIIEKEEGTYADKNAKLDIESISWNHSISEVLGSLLGAGLKLDVFKEFDYSPYDCFKNTEPVGEGKFRIKNFQSKVPLVYALKATK